MLAAIVGVFPARPDALPVAPVLGILISAAFTWVFSHLSPYHEDNDNVISVVLAYSLMFMFLAALLAELRECTETSEDETDEAVLGGLLIFFLFSGPLVIVLLSIEQIWSAIRNRAKMRNKNAMGSNENIEKEKHAMGSNENIEEEKRNMGSNENIEEENGANEVDENYEVKDTGGGDEITAPTGRRQRSLSADRTPSRSRTSTNSHMVGSYIADI